MRIHDFSVSGKQFGIKVVRIIMHLHLESNKEKVD